MPRKQPTLSKEARDQARFMYSQDGLTTIDIANYMGVGEGAVRWAVKDILRPRKDPTALIAAIEGGCTYVPKLVAMGYCLSSVKYHIKKIQKANATKTLQQKTRTIRQQSRSFHPLPVPPPSVPPTHRN